MLYLITLIKYLIVTSIMSGVLLYFFPNKIVLVIGVIFILSSFSAAKQEVREKKEAQKNNKTEGEK